MRTRITIAVVVAQLAVLGFMAGEREWVLQTGRTMYLRTAPVDPRDPMRGDYVRFDYEIGHVPRRLWRDGVAGWLNSNWREQRAVRDRRVFAQVQPDEEGVAQLVAVTDREPAARTYLRGRVAAIQQHGLDVRFGVEALFLEQGKAKALEQSRNARAGVPLGIEVAVNDDGLAVMKGYRWEPLGIVLNLERADRSATAGAGGPLPGAPRALQGVTVELKNHGEMPVAIVALPDAQSFRLVPNERWAEQRHRWAGGDAAVPKPTADTVRVLRPGESYRERIDFTAPAWWVREARSGGQGGWGEPVPWEKLNNAWNASFRIEYAPPARADCVELPQAELIRHSRLRSRAFSAAGAVD